MVPKARPMSQVASAQPVSSRSVTSGRADVVRSRSLCSRPEHRVAHRPADQRQRVARGGEALAERPEDGLHPVELGADPALHLAHLERRQRRRGAGAISVGHDRQA